MRHESRQSGISFDVSMSWEPNHAVLLLELVLFSVNQKQCGCALFA